MLLDFLSDQSTSTFTPPPPPPVQTIDAAQAVGGIATKEALIKLWGLHRW